MKRRQEGFTLIELLLATALFSFILLFVTTGFIQVNRAYNKGLTVKRIHQSAREIIDELSRAMLESTSEFPLQKGTADYGSYPSEWICIDGGKVSYEWVKRYVEPQNQYFNFGRRLNHCGSIGIAGSYPRGGGEVENMLDELVAVQDIIIEPFGPANTYRIVVKLASNSENTDFDQNQPCDPTDSYCDFVELNTVVTLRR
jgi:prepilin-type N-terminal cleavage/methylation domain-containing protein